MQNSFDLALWLAIWMAAAAVILYSRWNSSSAGAGLGLVYLLHLWLIHWVAASIYLLPWYQNYDLSLVDLGFQQSAYGVVAFAAGSLVLTPIVLSFRHFPTRLPVSYESHPRLAKAYMLVGGVSYLLLSSTLGRLPTASALVSVGQQLFVVGLCLSCWQAWQEKDLKRFIGWSGTALLMPLITITSRGFIGYGAVATFTVLMFIASFYRPRWQFVMAALLLGYLGLSFYGSYMRDRDDIREVVWGGQPWRDRLEQVYETISTLEWFDPLDEGQLWRIDDRLNQNYLVGAAISHLATVGNYAYGETMSQALLALIPRAIWPDKPIYAGSPQLVSQYTGFQFAEGTSVGIGQVMEFYINFGTMGVVLGFLGMGVIITIIDSMAGQRLVNGDWQGFALWYSTGISFLQVGGSLVEVTSSAGASVVAALLINKSLLHRLQRTKSSSASAPTPSPIRTLQGQSPKP